MPIWAGRIELGSRSIFRQVAAPGSRSIVERGTAMLNLAAKGTVTLE